MIVVVNVDIIKVFLESYRKCLLQELVLLLIWRVKLKIVRINVCDDVSDRINRYLNEWLFGLTYEVDLSSVDPNGLLHYANVTVIYLTLLINGWLVQEWQIKIKFRRVWDGVVKLELNRQYIGICRILEQVVCKFGWRELLILLCKLLVPPLYLIILTFLLLLQLLLSNSYILFVIMYWLKNIFLWL